MASCCQTKHQFRPIQKLNTHSSSKPSPVVRIQRDTEQLQRRNVEPLWGRFVFLFGSFLVSVVVFVAPTANTAPVSACFILTAVSGSVFVSAG